VGSLQEKYECSDVCHETWQVIDQPSDPLPDATLVIEKYNSTGSTVSDKCKCNSLDQFIRYKYNEARSDNDNFTSTNGNGNKTVVGTTLPSSQIEYLTSSYPAKGLKIFAQVNNSFYEISYHAFEEALYSKRLPQIQNVLGSIEFLPVERTALPILSSLSTNDTSKIYENRDTGIKLSYPSNWGNIVEKSEGCPKSACVSSSDGTSQVRFGIFSVSKDICKCSLKDFIRTIYKVNEKGVNGFSFINDNQTIVGKKYPSWQYEYSIVNENNNISKGLTILTTNNETHFGFAFVYPNVSQTKLIPEFKKVIDSIEFVPIKVAKRPSFIDANETEMMIPEIQTGNNPNRLEILSHNSFTDSLGFMHVVGEVQNNSPTNAQFVQITGTFYDNNNQVVGTEFTYTHPSDIGAGDKAPFEIILTSTSVPVSEIDRYSLTASSG